MEENYAALSSGGELNQCGNELQEIIITHETYGNKHKQYYYYRKMCMKIYYFFFK